MLRRSRVEHAAHIRVVGVGSGGITAVNDLLSREIDGVDFIVVDSDPACLAQAAAPTRIQVENRTDLGEQLEGPLYGTDLLFVLGGLGGRTATKLAPVVAAAGRESGALVVAIVTLPFSFEGPRRARVARAGSERLRQAVNTLITIPNDRLLQLAGEEISFHETYRLAQEVWYQSVQGINDLVNVPGLVNVDFADVRAIMEAGGAAIISTGRARGPQRARRAAAQATTSRLLGLTIDGAHGILFNVAGGPDMTLQEVEQAADIIGAHADPEANIIFGAAVDVTLEDEIKITVVATGSRVEEPGDSRGEEEHEPAAAQPMAAAQPVAAAQPAPPTSVPAPTSAAMTAARLARLARRRLRLPLPAVLHQETATG